MVSWKGIKDAYNLVCKGKVKRVDVEGAIVYRVGKKVRIDADIPGEEETDEGGS